MNDTDFCFAVEEDKLNISWTDNEVLCDCCDDPLEFGVTLNSEQMLDLFITLRNHYESCD